MSFDTLAPYYRAMEFVSAGNRLQRCRTEFLPRIHNAENILILGEGNGRFLAACRRKNPTAKITCLDASEKMLTLARNRLLRSEANIEGVTFICADALQWIPSDHYDAVVTHFFLDCFPSDQLRLLVGKFGTVATSNAVWLLADFQTPEKRIFCWRARIILWSLYAFFRCVTGISARRLASPDMWLQEQGFRLQERRETEWGLLHSDCWRRTA